MSLQRHKSRRDDLIEIVDDGGGGAPGGERPRPWRVLVVDDEREVHAATLFALKDGVVEFSVKGPYKRRTVSIVPLETAAA